MLKQTLALVGFAFLIGCGDSFDTAPNVPASSHTVLHDGPDFTPRPGDVPVAGDTVISRTEFRIHVTADGKLYRNGSPMSKTEIIDELLGTPNVNEVTAILKCEYDVKISLVSKLRSDLSEAVPNLGTIVIAVADTTNGG